MSRTENGDWHAYFWPASTVLRNKLTITVGDDLREIEYRVAELRAQEIRNGTLRIDHTFDAAHLKAIHAHLFGDVYDWAGQYRTVNISRGGAGKVTHHFGDHSSMDMYMRQVRRLIETTPWRDLEPDELADALANVHTRLNFAHPFREGNGRTTRIFMQHLAQHAGAVLDFGRVTAEAWNSASAATFLHPYGLRGTASRSRRSTATSPAGSDTPTGPGARPDPSRSLTLSQCQG